MTNERFQELVKELRDNSMDTMLKKNSNYADADRLHNFKVGAAITGGTPAQAALGYMAKHMASHPQASGPLLVQLLMQPFQLVIRLPKVPQKRTEICQLSSSQRRGCSRRVSASAFRLMSM